MTSAWPDRPHVLLLGAGLMGAQIACEYAIGGLDIVVVSRDPDAARVRVDDAARHAIDLGVVPPSAADAVARKVRITDDAVELGPFHLVVESLPEQLAVKTDALGPLAERWPEATIATNTSSLSIAALGEALGAAERTIATHYLNPAMLMPIVEVVSSPLTDRAHVDRAVALLRRIGKEPVEVADVAGFVVNRLQFALLRECAWLIEHDVVAPADLDRIVRDGLARRWSQVGPLETASLGGVETFGRVAQNLFPELAGTEQPPVLHGVAALDPAALRTVEDARDRYLATFLTQLVDRSTS